MITNLSTAPVKCICCIITNHYTRWPGTVPTRGGHAQTHRPSPSISNATQECRKLGG